MARRRQDAGWLRRAQERRETQFAERGPVSHLPLPETDEAERITAAELEADAS